MTTFDRSTIDFRNMKVMLGSYYHKESTVHRLHQEKSINAM